MNVQVYKYRIPFSHPLKNSKTTFNHRKGFILQINKCDACFFGEAAPLPDFSHESIEEVESALTFHQQNIKQIFSSDDVLESLQEFYKNKNLPPSLSFAVDSIAYQIASFKNNQDLTDFLFPESPNKIAVNALADLSSDYVLENIGKKYSEEIETYKFKIGIDFKSELRTLNSIRNEFPDITLRLDANQSWTREESISNLRTLESLEIEYCEEPLSHVNAENINILSRETTIPIALDESLPQSKNINELMSATDVIIIKPTLWGSFSKIIQLKKQAEFHDCDVIFTTALETGIGRYFTALLASGLGSPIKAHGLGTGIFLSEDVISDSDCITGGLFHLTDAMKQIKNINLAKYSFLQEV